MGRPRHGPGGEGSPGNTLLLPENYRPLSAHLPAPPRTSQAWPEGQDRGLQEHSIAGSPWHVWPSDGERDSLAQAGSAAVSTVPKDGGLGGSEGGVTAAVLLTSWLFKEQPKSKLGNWMGSLRAQGIGSQGSGSLAG